MFDMEANPRRGGGFNIHPRSPEITRYCRRRIKQLTESEKKNGKALGYKEGAATVKWRKKQMKMHNNLINSASSYVGTQIKRHKHFCKVTDKIYELSRTYKEADDERRRKKTLQNHRDERERLKKVIPNLNQGNEWNEAFYRHCKRLKVMTHVDDPWLPDSERKIIESEPWKKKITSGTNNKLSPGKNSPMAERLIANTLMYSPSLAANQKISRGPSLLYLEDFVNDGIGYWPEEAKTIDKQLPYSALIQQRMKK
jgi:hypothetical protein